jgi:hypothetical protein
MARVIVTDDDVFRSKAKGGEDNTTAQSDTQNATAKAKKEHPESPDTVIGMQDERGGKGG